MPSSTLQAALVLLAGAFTACGQRESLPDQPPIFPSTPFTTADVSGCYSVHATWSGEPQFRIPDRVRLTLDAHRWPRAEPIVRPQTYVLDAGPAAPYSTWELAKPDRIKATWSNGKTAVRAELRVDRPRRALRGRAITFGQEPRSLPGEVVLRRIACERP